MKKNKQNRNVILIEPLYQIHEFRKSNKETKQMVFKTVIISALACISPLCRLPAL